MNKFRLWVFSSYVVTRRQVVGINTGAPVLEHAMSIANLPHQADNIVLKIRDSAVISFPNLRVALQILITLAMSFASSEC